MADEMMKQEDRDMLMEKMSMKLKEMSDEDLKSFAKEIGVEMEDAAAADVMASIAAKPVVDTGVLTGPIGGLKNFLLKSSREKEMK